VPLFLKRCHRHCPCVGRLGGAKKLARDRDLSHSEQLVMLAVLRLHPRAYGTTIRKLIVEKSKRKFAHATLYAALYRLMKKGYIIGNQSEPTPERGGRSKLLVTVTSDGHEALEQSLKSIDSLRDGIKSVERMA
jgi:PadR family transcriptional regulator, regulatory protein PadR